MTTMAPDKPLPVLTPDQLPEKAENTKWLIEQLWMDETVGIIGAPPKSLKDVPRIGDGHERGYRHALP